MRAYFDHAATSPLRPAARAAMEPFLSSANPSSLHREGRAARAAIDDARESVARSLGVAAREIVFTSGGTESIATALHGVANAGAPRRIITAPTEHRATLEACEVLRASGWEVEFVETDRDARVDPASFARALRSPAAIASFMLANNELGTINPIAELAALSRQHGVLFHCDGVAAAGASLEPRTLGVDLLSLSGHKFGGPLGTGILYIRDGIALKPLFPGSQEAARRGGTENVSGIVGCAAALAAVAVERDQEGARLGALSDRIEAVLPVQSGETLIIGAGAPRLGSISSLAFRGIDNEALLVCLDLGGVAVSTGSACAAGAGDPSHVIAALPLPSWVARSVIRISLGWSTTEEDVDRLLRMVPKTIKEMRETMREEVKR